MELPEYKAPSLARAFGSMCQRGWSYIVKAGTVILLCYAVVYIMQSFNLKLQLVEEGAANTSILAVIANPVSVLFVPIAGIAAWQLAAAAVAGFIAKENVVGTLAVCYGISNLIDTETFEMAKGAGSGIASAMGITTVAALAYLIFNLFSPPCFAAIGAMNAELKSAKWLWGAIGFQMGIGYTAAYLVYTIGTLITGGTLNVGAAIGGLIAVLVFIGVIVYLMVNADKKQTVKAK